MRAAGVLLAACCLLPARASAQAPVIADVRVEQEGQAVTDRVILGLIETMAGRPLSMRDVRETIAHLTSLNRFEDVQVFQEPAGGGVRVRYVLFPLHAVDRMEFRGMLGLSEGEVRRMMTDRFGAAPANARADEAAETLRAFYRSRGFVAAQVTPRIEETHNPDRATMAFDIAAGARAVIGRVEVDEVDATDREIVPGNIGITAGDPYDTEAIARELDDYVGNLRARGFYEATATQSVSFEQDGRATVRIVIDRGPLVTVAFAGDPLPPAERERLVPVRAEGSADEDLLEDASFAVEQYFQARGYRGVVVNYSREANGGELVITFTIKQGRRHVVTIIALDGNRSIPDGELLQLLRIKEGEPFVQAALDGGVAAVRDAYRARGFTRPVLQPSVTELPSAGGDQEVQVRLNITEGPRTLVGELAFAGNTVFDEAQLRSMMTTAPGRPFSEAELSADRDRVELEYLNRGYESVQVAPATTLADNGTRADVRVAVTEGPQIIVDHVIIVGNERTSTETIERELLLRPGEPLGYTARIESQQRLAALGLFRRVTIDEVRRGGEPRRDVIVQVEEAPPTTVGFGGGVEGGVRLRPTGEGGQAEERFEVVPRGFFEVGRRNLWGKNRSVNLFTRVSLRARDVILSSSGIRFEEPAAESGVGFNEYRVLGTYREPRVFNTPADVLVTGILDQAIRSSFNFITREARAEMGLRLSPRYSLAGRYSYEHTRLFDERFTDAEKPLIDRVFPQVRLSTFSGTLIRDSRNDGVDPERGTFVVLDGQATARAFGSEVGFLRSFVQAFQYYRVPAARRTVFVVGARLGAAHGFRREVAGEDGSVAVVQDLPASERFFAGGDTTVRGFSLDRLGTDPTISPTGFPTGGNGLVVTNAEVRVALFGGVGATGFLDAGNVFRRATDIDLGQLRATAGFGISYNSPIGPLRVDLGFKLDRRELTPGRLERRSVLHFFLGQPF